MKERTISFVGSVCSKIKKGDLHGKVPFSMERLLVALGAWFSRDQDIHDLPVCVPCHPGGTVGRRGVVCG